MVTREEITRGHDIPTEYEDNLCNLLTNINKLRLLWGSPMIVSSGYRTLDAHKRIYANKKIIPMKSKHLFCQAVDIVDTEQKLQKWLTQNPKILEECGLWCEDFSFTPNWVHLQSVPYGSWIPGKSRWFRPW